MDISVRWLNDYFHHPVAATPAEIADRLTLAGLNLGDRGVLAVGTDAVIDVEVTSNRPDCLGHLGVAREVGVLYDLPVKVPNPQPATNSTPTATVTNVAIECPELCSQYVARVIRGVKVAESPEWLRERLIAVGVNPVNNIVDITNFVLMECAQPLHAFDFDKLRGGKIVVRRAKAGEKLQAIDHAEYPLTPEMCVIADAERPVAIAGVMGGAETEIQAGTVNVLIEAAAFAPLTIRATSRKLDLKSPSQYRFERALDLHGPEWASRRCCELILQLAGGELLEGAVTVGQPLPAEPDPVTLRFAQIPRILGIDIPATEAVRLLAGLGCRLSGSPTETSATFVPLSSRRDLSREIDLIEEIARLRGYDAIPVDQPVRLCASAKSLRDRVTERVRETMIGTGFFEAMTVSFVGEQACKSFQPFGENPLLAVNHSKRRQDAILRQSLIPSLLVSRRHNERFGTFNAQLFEIAKVYLQANRALPERQVEPTLISCVSAWSYLELKGVVELLATRLRRDAVVTVRPSPLPAFTPGRGAEVLVDGVLLGWLGELDRQVTDLFDLKDAVSVAELQLAVLEDLAELQPKLKPMSDYQGVQRDLNFILEESITWDRLEQVVRQAAGPLAEGVAFAGQYRGKQIPENKKSYLVTIHYRAGDRSLTSEEVETWQQAIIAACNQELAATLRA